MPNMLPTASLPVFLAIAALCPQGTAEAATADCSATIESTDAMQFNTRTLVVPARCERFAVTLRHTGRLPATTMGHNFVLGRDADIAGIAADGMRAGPASSYVRPDDPRVIASSSVIGGGQSTTVTISVARLEPGERYTFICSFPGHAAIMRGALRVATSPDAQ